MCPRLLRAAARSPISRAAVIDGNARHDGAVEMAGACSGKVYALPGKNMLEHIDAGALSYRRNGSISTESALADMRVVSVSKRKEVQIRTWRSG